MGVKPKVYLHHNMGLVNSCLYKSNESLILKLRHCDDHLSGLTSDVNTPNVY